MKLSTLLRYALPVGAMVLAWLARALRDGRVTRAEIYDLIESIAELVGVHLDIDDSDAAPVPGSVVTESTTTRVVRPASEGGR